MRRYTLTPESRKTIKIPTSTIKATAFPRMSVSAEESKQNQVRNVRDKDYKNSCADNILNFLNKNNFDGNASHKMLHNPTNKDFQNIFKFLYSFIDCTVFVKFEDEAINILKMIKYPYCGEITKSQLSAITPHAWPVLLAMLSWMVDLISQTEENKDKTLSIECEFLDFICEGYIKYMLENRDDPEFEIDFINRIASMHGKASEENEIRRKEVELMNNELENLKSKFEDLNKLENKKKKINEDLNTLIMHEKQLEIKKEKYAASTQKLKGEVDILQREILSLLEVKKDLEQQIDAQTINPEDIREMNVEKVELFNELERIKPERERLTRVLKDLENNVNEKMEENERIMAELNSCRKEFNLGSDVYEMKGHVQSYIVQLENELNSRKEELINYELNISALEDKAQDKAQAFKDQEDQYNNYSSKLQMIGAIYLEKKEISERSQQKNRSEMDKLDNELLKLKLESDSAYLKSEKDISESKIRLDILKSQIATEKEEISKIIWDFNNHMNSCLKNIETQESELVKIVNPK
jgi:kinetochore protein NDC80